MSEAVVETIVELKPHYKIVCVRRRLPIVVVNENGTALEVGDSAGVIGAIV